MWGAKGGSWAQVFDWALKDSVTAVAFAPIPTKTLRTLSADHHALSYVLAAGLENGDVLLLSASDDTAAASDAGTKWHTEPLCIFDTLDSHASSVRKFAWANAPAAAGTSLHIHLASASSDHSVRIFDVTFASVKPN